MYCLSWKQDLSSTRRIQPSDYYLLEAVLTNIVRRVQARNNKQAFKHIDIKTMMAGLYQMDHAYIVADAYLVAYEVGSPWYSNTLFLQEQIVAHIAGPSGLHVVTDFLEQAGREAGAKLAIAGTALAMSDPALASLYQREGYIIGAYTLTKDI